MDSKLRHHVVDRSGGVWQSKPDLCGSRNTPSGHRLQYDDAGFVWRADGSWIGDHHNPGNQLGGDGRLDSRLHDRGPPCAPVLCERHRHSAKLDHRHSYYAVDRPGGKRQSNSNLRGSRNSPGGRRLQHDHQGSVRRADSRWIGDHHHPSHQLGGDGRLDRRLHDVVSPRSPVLRRRHGRSPDLDCR